MMAATILLNLWMVRPLLFWVMTLTRSALSTLPEPMANRKVDQARLREMRKRLEGHVPPKEVETMFHEILSETIDLCTDYIGNVVVQKILEKSPDNHRVALMEQISPHMAVIGVHKNGTWVVQKMIDIAKTPAQMAVIVNSLKKYTPPLLLDQFGNYVVQCCLRMGPQRNQFIFDAMHTKIVDIGFGRFGARAVRACLESQYTTKRQQKHVAMSIVQNAGQLVTNPNGAILVTWLLDTSSLPGRYRVIAPKLVPFVAAFCNHKLASSTILKLVNQRIELDAREVIIKELFFRDENILREVLSDFSHGVSTIQKILSTACVTPEERVRLADRVRLVLSRLPEVQENPVGFKRLLDELAAIPSSLSLNDPSPLNSHDIVSPLTPMQGSSPTR
ncbi:armadillo-type protein [Chytridium lagenaria]|nr:armadillo-type protein [Chytridium lagenaria]